MSSGPRRLLALPAMPNVHSHAFQRLLRGVAERQPPPSEADDFWTWRDAMYRAAAALDPDSMREVARTVYAEMLHAGYGAVGEFHYVHHQPDGTPYEDPNAMAKALAEAAREVGIAIVLLPAAYQRAGWAGEDLPPAPLQRRFCDPTIDAFLSRVAALRAWAGDLDGVGVGIAAHSVRSVSAAWLRDIAAYAHEHGLVMHIHAHEQPLELEQCAAEHGCSPIELLDRVGFLGERTTIVHGVHVEGADLLRVADAGAIVASCPTTEGNLGDGSFPALRWKHAGAQIAVGSDSQAIVDPFEELRELETLARREGLTRRGLLGADGDLWGRTAAAGRLSIGLPASEAGGIAVDLDHPRLAGVPEEDALRALVTCASADVVAVSAGGER